MRHEDLNPAAEILSGIEHLFTDVRVRWFPQPPRHLAFYGYIEASRPRLARCDQISRKREGQGWILTPVASSAMSGSSGSTRSQPPPGLWSGNRHGRRSKPARSPDPL